MMGVPQPRLRYGGSILALALAGILGGAGLASLALAQAAPESILPPGFDDPAPTPSPSPSPTRRPSPGAAAPAPGPVQPGASGPGAAAGPGELPPVPELSGEELERLPTLDELEAMSTDELDVLLGLRPRFDIPPGSRRALTRVGLLAFEEGGLPPRALENQPAALVRAALAGTRGPLVSRWGHILLRRALASRMGPPAGMDPLEFAALRAGVLNRLGEFAVSRAMVQDIDTGDWSSELVSEALVAYIAAGDFTGACPAVRVQGSTREDGQWRMLQAICNAYAGEAALAATQLDRALYQGIAPRIDVLLARRFAGAAGRGQRAVEIEWGEVEELNPWRFGLAAALGEPVPGALLDSALSAPSGAYYARAGALLPMLPAAERARFAGRAASEGVLSASALIDLYSEAQAGAAAEGEVAQRAASLREAYLATEPAARIGAIQRLWGEGDASGRRDGHAARVLTAYAAARIPPAAAHADVAGELIASMLTAGLDRDAVAWRDIVGDGTLGWALITLSDARGAPAQQGAINAFLDEDDSEGARRSAFLIAGLAGLERIGSGQVASLSDRLGISLYRQTRWTRTIARAAELGNPALVALLAGLGMQGTRWEQMTPLHLYHITSALRRVGFEAEARMIAAEAVARA